MNKSIWNKIFFFYFVSHNKSLVVYYLYIDIYLPKHWVGLRFQPEGDHQLFLKCFKIRKKTDDHPYVGTQVNSQHGQIIADD